MSRLLDGAALAKRLNRSLAGRVRAHADPPGLAVVLVGADPASQVYVRRKGVVAGRIGMRHQQIDLPADVSQRRLIEVVHTLNADPAVDGILVQLPLPDGLDADAVTAAIDPTKDVDGLTAISAGLLAQGRPGLVPCTPRGVMALLDDAGVAVSGKRAVVLGRSNIVGRPMAMLLEQANATVTVCHSRTPDAAAIAREADILVAAIGRPRLVDTSWVKPGAVVIDVGIHRLADGSLCGDVDGASVADVAAAMTPAPGGVGPMTIAMLMDNTYRAWAARRGDGDR